VQQEVHGAGPTPDQVLLGGLVRAHRARLRLTQEQLAERAGLSERTLRNLEGDRIRRPYPDTIRRLADALQLTGAHRDQLEAAARGVAPEVAPEPTVPSLLPPSVTDFTGREEEVAAVLGLLASDGVEEAAHAVVISAVAGKPGIGKTTLAVHSAHRLRSEFPDGQLYVNLQGAQARPLDPSEVLARFLRALGMHGSSIPDDLEERAERYRTLLADRRMLMVLDNAAGEAQVRPLLPGSPACGVVVTSRTRLPGLEGARLLDLDVLPFEAAVQLLARVAGPARTAAEPDAAAAIVGYCGRLPLVIRIAGARLAARPTWSLARLAERLADEHRRLDELTAGDLELRASIALSYRALPDLHQQTFRRLGMLDTPDFPAWVAGALLDLPTERAEELMEALVDAHLLEAGGIDQVGQARYRFHDLLRVFARERAAVEDPSHDQDAALARAFGGWLALAEQADQHTDQRTMRVIHGDAPRWHPQMTAAVVTDPLGWFEAERAALIAAVQQASAIRLDELAWDLAGCLARFLFTRNYSDDWRRTQEAGVTAARRAGNRRGQAYALLTLGELHAHHDRLNDALACLQESLALFVELGDQHGQASTLENVGSIQRLLGDHELAADCFERALTIFTAVDDRVGAAGVMVALAAMYLDQGHPDARMYLERALAVFNGIGDRHTGAQVLRKLAWYHERHGELDRAADQLTQALAIMRELCDRLGEALTLEQLGEVNLRLGRLPVARALLEEALSVFSTYQDHYGQARALRARGELHHAEGEYGRATDDLEQSLACWRELDLPLWEARTLADLGDVYAAVGNQGAAEAAWREALAEFEALGAPEGRTLAERLMPSVGGALPGKPPSSSLAR
jgi:tetratricopeptide (TPR) repeat protein